MELVKILLIKLIEPCFIIVWVQVMIKSTKTEVFFTKIGWVSTNNPQSVEFRTTEWNKESNYQKIYDAAPKVGKRITFQRHFRRET